MQLILFFWKYTNGTMPYTQICILKITCLRAPSVEILTQAVLSETQESMFLKWSCDDSNEPLDLETSGL